MAIDPSIALSVKPVQIQNPNEWVTNAYAMKQAQMTNQLNQMKMDEYSRGLAEQEQFKNELAQARTPEDVKNAFYKQGKVKEYNELLYKQAETGRLGAETTNLGYTGAETQVKTAKSKMEMLQSMARDLSTRPSDANITAHAEDIAASSLFTPEEKAAVKRRAAELLAKPMDQRVPNLASSGASAETLLNQNKPIEMTPGSVLVQPPTVSGGKATELYKAPDKSQASADIPKLKPGEVWDATSQTVKQVPGSAEYNKQSQAHGNDYNAVKTVIAKMDNAMSKVDSILAPENKSGFESNFGGYNAALTRQFTGNTAKVKKNIESLKSDMKSAGLELVRAGGSIGALTEREWPMLESQIDAIDYTLSEDDAKSAFNRVKATFERIKNQAKDTYKITWGETQYYKPEVAKAAPPAPPGAGKGANDPAYQAYLKSHPGAPR